MYVYCNQTTATYGTVKLSKFYFSTHMYVNAARRHCFLNGAIRQEERITFAKTMSEITV